MEVISARNPAQMYPGCLVEMPFTKLSISHRSSGDRSRFPSQLVGLKYAVIMNYRKNTTLVEMKFTYILIVLVLTLINPHYSFSQNRCLVDHGTIEFKSEAPLELISASTSSFVGILDLDRNAFAISVPIFSFKGFNSALQREHFNENYMESEKYPKGIFKGLILDEDVELSKNGYYSVSTMGELVLHGVEKKRKISCEIKVEDDLITVKSEFDVLLDDHKIKIPTIVSKKLSEIIHVSIEATFVKKS